MRIPIVAVIAALAAARVAAAQGATIDHYTQSQIESMVQNLAKKAAASPSGQAGDTLKNYGPDLSMVSVRTKDGGAEVHAEYADFFYVLKGKGTLLTGGEVIGGKSTGPGETRGTGLKNAERTPLGEGDVVHIPAGVPHQMLLDNGGEFDYFVIKVKEGAGK